MIITCVDCGDGGGRATVLVAFMVLLVSVQGWRCCGDALVLAWCDEWCDGFKSLRRCGVADVVMLAWRDDVVMLWPFCGGAVPDDGWQFVLKNTKFQDHDRGNHHNNNISIEAMTMQDKHRPCQGVCVCVLTLNSMCRSKENLS